MTSFKALPLVDLLHVSLQQRGFQQMTEVQAATLPHALAREDVVAQAKTGSGKTLAFALTALQQIDISQSAPQVLVVCPTRELAEQVATVMRELGSTLANLRVLTLCGGSPVNTHVQALQQPAHILVGTPGRLEDLLIRKKLVLTHINIRVLDEADRLLDMGFADTIERLFKATPPKVQTLMFSATFSAQVKGLVSRYTQSAFSFTENVEHTPATLQQTVFRVSESKRLYVLKALLSEYQPAQAVVFCNTRDNVRVVTEQLRQEGIVAAALEGEMAQQDRQNVLTLFASGVIHVLVASDVSARGLDVHYLDCVFHYELSDDPAVHIHRSGRTGRAGASGQVWCLCAESEEAKLARIQLALGRDLPAKGSDNLRFHSNRVPMPAFQAIWLGAGKKRKLRPGDLLGALTKDAGLPVTDIGKIVIFDHYTLMALKIRSVKPALTHFREGKVKSMKIAARRFVIGR